jgi:uncharacterized membrane protein
VTGRLEHLEDAIEKALTAGLALSTLLLVAGLVMGAAGPLRWGLLLLMVTPVVRVAVVTLGLALDRDWVFTLVSAFVLLVLGSGIWVALPR